MSEINRSMLGRFGIASKPSGSDFMAWATDGPSEADSPVHERSNFVVFEFGRTEQEAIDKIKKELCDLGVAEPEPAFLVLPNFMPELSDWAAPCYFWGGFFLALACCGLLYYFAG